MFFGSFRSAPARLARRIRSRRDYARSRDWAWSLYDRLLNSRPGHGLPGRGCVRPIELQGARGRPFLVRLGTSDIGVLQEIYVRREYDPVRSMLASAGSIVDLGANIGISVRLWREVFPASRVVAVEPDPANLELCRRNNPDDESITWVAACVSARTGRVRLDRSGQPWSYRMAPGGAPDTEALSMMDLLRLHAPAGPIDLLKCDIEGAEAELFVDCADWIHRVRHLIVEVHRPYSPEALAASLGTRFSTRTVLDFGVNALVFASRVDDQVPAGGSSGGGS